MSEEDTIVAILGVVGAIAALAAIVAAIKGRSSFGWVIATLIFPPLLLVLLFLPSARGADRQSGQSPARSARPSMPSWTQAPSTTESAAATFDQSDALQQALARASGQVQSEVGKRILGALASRVTAQAQQTRAQGEAQAKSAQQSRSMQARPQRTQATQARQQQQARPPQMQPKQATETRAAAPVPTLANWQPQTSAVRRVGSRETVIYRRG